jgi:hypothetical protein
MHKHVLQQNLVKFYIIRDYTQNIIAYYDIRNRDLLSTLNFKEILVALRQDASGSRPLHLKRQVQVKGQQHVVDHENQKENKTINNSSGISTTNQNK